MGSFLMRAIGASQRRMTLDHPNVTTIDDATQLAVDIQGVHLETASRSSSFSYESMAEKGIRDHGQRELTFWQRLFRKPATIGSAAELPDGQLRISFWTDPALVITLNPEEPGIFDTWSGICGLIQAAGFSLEQPET